MGAVVATWTAGGREGPIHPATRMLTAPRGQGWLVVAVVIPLFLGALGLVIARIVDGAWPDVRRVGQSDGWPALGAWFGLVQFLTFAIGEETGWRGYAVPALQARYSALIATLILSLLWAFWHLPLFFMDVGTMSELRGLSLLGWFVSPLPGTIVLTWLVNKSGGALAAILFHGTINVAFTLPGSPAFQSSVGALLTLFALVVVAADFRGWTRAPPAPPQ